MQPKYKLLLDVVRVLGAEKAMEMFEKTAQIQEDGGVLTSQGDKKYVRPVVPDCVRSNLRGSKFKIFPGKKGGGEGGEHA